MHTHLRIARFVIVGFANVAREAVSQMTTLTIESQPLQRIRVLGRIRTFTILFATVAGVERIHFGKFRFALRLAMHSVSRFLKHAFDQAFVYNHRRMLLPESTNCCYERVGALSSRSGVILTHIHNQYSQLRSIIDNYNVYSARKHTQWIPRRCKAWTQGETTADSHVVCRLMRGAHTKKKIPTE